MTARTSLSVKSRGVWLVLWLAIDETEQRHPNTGFYAVAGVVLSDDARIEAEVRWRAILSEFNISYFHATEHKHWSDLHAKLLPVVTATVSHVITVGVVRSAFDALSLEQKRRFRQKHVYWPCLQDCIEYGARYADSVNEEIKVVVEQQANFGTAAKRHYDYVKVALATPTRNVDGVGQARAAARLSGFGYEEKGKEVVLQMADWLAFEFGHGARRTLELTAASGILTRAPLPPLLARMVNAVAGGTGTISVKEKVYTTTEALMRKMPMRLQRDGK